MRIGIDGRSLTTNRAIFRYTKNLLNSLSEIDKENEYLLFMEGGQPLSEIKYLYLSTNWKLIKAPHKIVLKDHLVFNSFINKFNLDVFFHPDNTEFLNCHPRSIVTIHDLIPFLLPDISLSSNPVTRWRQKIYLKLQKKALKNSTARVIAVSNNTKKDLVQTFGFLPEAISVVYEAAENSFKPAEVGKITGAKKEYGIVGDYIFCHAGFSPYKNVLFLVKVFADFSRLAPEVSLVLGGAYNNKDPYQKLILREIARQSLTRKVIFTGYIEENKLPAIYSGANIFVYPSLYEGFGIPVLEAQACGVPVLSSKAASLTEVGGFGAEFFDPYEASDLLEKLVRIYKDDSFLKDLTAKGFMNVSRFSWLKTAEQTLSVFKEVYRSSL